MRVAGKRKLLAWLAVGLASAVLIAAAAVVWVVPRVIVGRLEAGLGGKVEIAGWWYGVASAGVTGLKVHEGPSADSPVWLAAARVSTDLASPRALTVGAADTGRVRLEAPEVSLRLDRRGKLLTPLNVSAGGPSTRPVPVVIADGATVRVRQEGRPPLVVSRVTARLGPDGGKLRLAARSSDPEWGPLEAHGELDKSLRAGRIELKTLAPVRATPAMAAALPFVPREVWDNVAPEGRLDVRLVVDLGAPGGLPEGLRAEIGLRDTAVTSRSLDLTATGTTGRLTVDGLLVRVEKVSGQALGGRVSADGVLDFRAEPPRFDVGLALDRINVADAPKSWQLDEAGVTGRLSGKVKLAARLDPKGVDLSGTTGEAVVTGGEVQGIPFQSLRLVMTARGNDLRYETPRDRSSSNGTSLLPSPLAGEGPGVRGDCVAPAEPVAPGGIPLTLTLSRKGRGDKSGFGELMGVLATVTSEGLIPFQAPDRPAEAKPQPSRPVIQLPKSLTTHIELADVDLTKLVRRAEFLLGYPFPVPVSGRLTLKADATIPLGHLRSVRDYAFHGDLTLSGASLYRVDLGRVSARVDLEGGVLVLKDFRGRLEDRPDGGPDNPPPEAGGDVPRSGPLPRGGFRGTLRAEVSPPGKLTARFEGDLLPMGELAAPLLPRPTPLSGLATMTIQAAADLGAARDPAAWTASGTVRSREITYRGAALDGLAARFRLARAHLDISDLTARLLDRPLAATLGLDLKPPRAFAGSVDVTGWDLARVLAWLPAAPRPSPVSGTVTARAEARGSLEPFALETSGRGRLDDFHAGPAPLGAVPFEWATRGDVVTVAVPEAHPFGGRVSARAAVPLRAGRPVEGAATAEAIDTARLAAALPVRGLRLGGKAGGSVRFSVPAVVSALVASARLTSSELTVQGVPAERLEVSLRARGGSLGYEVTAESLGGTFRLSGSMPLGAAPIRAEADGEARAVGFRLDRLWEALGMTGAVTKISGQGALDANLRAMFSGPGAGLYAHGVLEVRDLRWGRSDLAGRARGIVAATPEVWRVDPLNGELLGGVFSGFVWGDGPARLGRHQGGFEVKLDRASLREFIAVLGAPKVEVTGYGTLRVAGSFGEATRASAELTVPSARVAGLPLTGLRLPVELSAAGGIGAGAGVVNVRRWSARLAGGHVHGDASFRLGEERAFQAGVDLAEVDLESIARVESEARRPASGKISGRVTLAGPDPALPQRYRGKVNLDLDDASLVALPLFREIDRFLGSARGGLFEDGDLAATIANRHLIVDPLTLQGRLAQVHATGTVGFDGQLNLEVLVNTNQIIPQTGQALVSLIPGLGGVLNRNREANLRVANYLSTRLLKLRVTGTLTNPSVAADPGVGVGETAVGFFAGVLKLPLGMVK